MEKTQHSTRFLYIIQTSHSNTLGFGVATNPQRRLQDYVAHSAAKQEFYQLYYGPKSDIDALETYIKNEWMPYRLDINGSWKLEWFDPKHKKSCQALEQLIDDKIKGHPMPDVRKLADIYAPFKNYYSKSDITKVNLDHDPDKYLQKIG